MHLSLPFFKTCATCVNSPTFPKHEHREELQVFHVMPVNQTLIRKSKKNNNTRLFGSSPWGLVAMYAVTQWPAPFIKSSCLGWVWANALQYDSHYTPQWASCAPRLPLILFWVQGFPTSSLVLSSALLSLSLSPSLTLFSTVAFALSTFIQTFLWGTVSLYSLVVKLLKPIARSSFRWQLLDTVFLVQRSQVALVIIFTGWSEVNEKSE